MPEIIPITDLRQDAAAVLLSMAQYERTRRQLELLRLLARGEKEIGAGHGHSLASVLKEADSLLDDSDS